jgi:hypothetical protein
VRTCTRAKERIARRTREVERRRQRADGVDVGPTSLSPLQRAHGMHRQARNGREFLLRETRRLTERFELPAK